MMKSTSKHAIGRISILRSASALALLGVGASIADPMSIANAQSSVEFNVGDRILNPLTGDEERILTIIGDVALTEADRLVLLATDIGTVLTDPADSANNVTIASVVRNATTNAIEQVVFEDGRTLDVVRDVSSSLRADTTLPTLPDLSLRPPLAGPSGNIGRVNSRIDGSNGGAGSNLRARIGIPPWIAPTNGGTGNAASARTVTRTATTETTSGIGVSYSTVSGDGGRGGNLTFSITGGSAGNGGRGGTGGTLNITLGETGNITTSGANGHGLRVLSVGGDGGRGGNAFALVDANGGTGGRGGTGGSATARNRGDITTRGTGALGLLAQSFGGQAGAGGTGGGLIVGDPGGGAGGGTGGTATALNFGTLYTFGAGAHGQLAQSIGGNGSSSGTGGGIVALGGAAGSGGNGGTAISRVEAGGLTATFGRNAVGAMAQSIGGGGGTGGAGGGIVTIGSTGAAGGSGGTSDVINATQGLIYTEGVGSHGLLSQSIGGGGGHGGAGGGIVAIGSTGSGGGAGGLALGSTQAGSLTYTTGSFANGLVVQSIGGGGGASGPSGGLVAIGGRSSSGGAGGRVIVTSAGDIVTSGVDSRGIVAQSIGGGGGIGSGTGGLVAVGGQGGGGGSANTVSVTNSGRIFTSGYGADGILGQSIAGGGGASGASGGAVSVGGSGTGGGGTANTVTLTNTGLISTDGDVAIGMLGQSIGGGGGAGGHNGGLVAIGGSATSAGAGGRVTITNRGDIVTTGLGSIGMIGQSIGGGGGTGGTSGGVLFTLGGRGGGGGGSNTVTLTNSRNLLTLGDDAHGILAQSVGGGGGNGGGSANLSAFVGVGIGGSGGSGGSAGTVDLNFSTFTADLDGTLTTLNPVIETRGDRAAGFVAQSVGGGGGNGGFAVQATAGAFGAVSVAVGGSGGSGGRGGTVDIDGSATILTRGIASTGMLAQSIGGGGGNGGFTVSAALAGGPGAGSVSVGVGGSGGSGLPGGKVDLDSGGLIVTEGDLSNGLVAQSVGGGGGNGGFNINLAGAGGVAGAASVAVGVGGSGSGGGTGGTVETDYIGTVITEGDNATAVITQSVGGGGGNGGFNITSNVAFAPGGAGGASVGVGGGGGRASTGGIVTTNFTGDIGTLGDFSDALLVQSLGGGGGNGGFNIAGSINGSAGGALGVAVGVGGSAGGGGNGNAVTLNLDGNIATGGFDADGVIAQSLGGGGGNGGVNVSGALTGTTSGGGISVGVGGTGGNAGNGLGVTAGASGSISTFGDESTAFLAQSLGGGGGNGGVNVAGAVSITSSAGGGLSVGVGGAGGPGGSAADVAATLATDIYTEGNASEGIVAQSLGGGGGNGGVNVAGSLTASAGSGGSVAIGVGGAGGGAGGSGAVTLTQEGSVTTLGDESVGILAQSLGGGGGNGGVNVSAGVTGSASGNANLSVGVGGAGGAGGSSGSVTATIAGDVSTAGQRSSAIMAQSLGGGGGNGGVNVAGTLALTSSSSGNVAVGIGGAGGKAGSAESATLTLVGSAIATGDESDGVIVQSLGGGGGNGGVNVAGGLTFAGSTSGTLAVGVGGFGGSGGSAESVTANITGDVIGGASGSGLITQSIGGGGGNGAVNISGGINIARGAGLAVGIGGFGGTAGNAGSVTVNATDGTFVGSGGFQSAALIQSLGGGGGDGAVNVSGGISLQGALAVGVGGFAGSGGSGSDVTARLNNDLVVDGMFSSGLLAQSIGGGGGRGGINVSGTISGLSGGTLPSLAFGLGGSAGNGSQAGTVFVDHSGMTVANGFLSRGIAAQSIGGGGGTGGLNVAANLSGAQRNTVAGSFGIGGSGGDGGNGADVTVASDGNILVNLAESDPNALPNLNGIGLLAQSVGGGGGDGGANFAGVASVNASPISVALGGSGAGGGDAGNVIVSRGLETASLMQIDGAYSHGLLAQSIGGGGGTGGFNFTLNLNPGQQTRLNGAVRIGGAGGEGGIARNVTVTDASNIITTGLNSTGLAAQSIAGGGGASSVNFGFDGLRPNSDTVNLNFSLGGEAGDGGMSGTVTVNQSGQIATTGRDSIGIKAQSIAGGGGSIGSSYNYGIGGGSALAVAVGRVGGSGGTSGLVTVDSSGIVTTEGDGAYALLAQSIAGGGGDSSTTSVSGSTDSGSGEGQVAWSGEYSQGQVGGEGGAAGRVNIIQSGGLQTIGDDASAILAQSIGGGGGAGGSALIDLVQQILSLPTSSTDSIGLSVQRGGVGGMGGLGGSVDVVTSGEILTFGDRSHGVNAMSIGGGGGEGGTVTNIALGGTGTNAQFEVGLGGEGGTGGLGGSVMAINTGIIQTSGDDSHGIRGMSIGGGGGDAGMVATFTGAFSSASDQTVSTTVNLGASGGAGNLGGVVDVINGVEDDFASSTILTLGDGSHGLFAQSIGGGGGNGSTVLNFSAASGGASFGTTALALNVGGKGGTGAAGGLVNAINRGMIETQGDGAYGIFAQSLGGGGGNGGLALAGSLQPPTPGAINSILISVGGDGGTGGDGGAVTVDNLGSILTRGDGAHGIYAQSIGGGGGNASLALSGSNDLAGMAVSTAISAIVGAIATRPGEGGTGGAVTVNSSGDITVLGDNAEAVVAQSINGGGGGYAFDLRGIAVDVFGAGFDLEDELDRPVFTIGGGAQEIFGETSERVTVNLTGTLQAGGAGSIAESLQAVSGGGGRTLANIELEAGEGDISPIDLDLYLGATGGGNNRGGDISSIRSGDLLVIGDGATGLFAQSIGGGGGRTRVDARYEAGALGDLSLRLGAIGGDNDAGGLIELVRTGNAGIGGVNAYGGIVQSIGGGGGSFNLSLSELESDPVVASTTKESLSGRHTIKLGAIVAEAPLLGTHAITFGSDGGTGLDGGQISLTQTGDTATMDDGAVAYLIQSIGAGGGDLRVSGLGELSAVFGGSNGASGNGGNLDIMFDGVIDTSGQSSDGLILQTIGGGGGAIRTDGSPVNVSLSSANSGDGGDIAFALDGSIITRGAGSTALIAQSLGGGGGLIGNTSTGSAGGDGAGGVIGLDIVGDVIAMGNGSTAIFAESAGASGRGAIDIAIAEDSMVYAGEGGIAIVLAGGSNNTIDNRGTIATADMLAGQAIIGGAGNDSVNNRGVIIGNVSLGGGLNSFTNLAGGELFSEQAVDLGTSSGLLVNSGLFDPGGMTVIESTSLTGSLTQTDIGELAVDMDLATRTHDAVNASGAVTLGGDVTVTLLNRYQLLPGRWDAPIVTGAEGVSLNDARLTADSTVVLNLLGLTTSSQAINVSYDIDFAPDGLVGSAQSVGEYFNAIRTAGTDAALDPLWVTLIDETNFDTYAGWLEQMGPDLYAEQNVQAIEISESLSTDLRTCGAAGLGASIKRGRACAWVKADTGTTERDGEPGIAATSSDRYSISAGAHYAINANWAVAAGISQHTDELVGAEQRWRSEGETLSVGLGVRYKNGKIGLGASAVYGAGNYVSQRDVSVLGAATATSDRDVTTISGVFDATYDYNLGDFQVVPNAALGFTSLSSDAVGEGAGGLLNLDVLSSDTTASWIAPGIRVAWNGSEDGTGFKPYAEVSVRQALSGDQVDVEARLDAAQSPSDATILAEADFGATRLHGEAGIEFISGNGFSVAAAYRVAQSDGRSLDSARLRLAIPF